MQEQAKHIRSLIKRLSPECPLRRLASSILTTGPQPIPTVQPLVSELTSFSIQRWKERTTAEWLLSQAVLTPEQHEDCFQALQHAVEVGIEPLKNEKWVWRWFRRVVRLNVGLFLLFIFCLLLSGIDEFLIDYGLGMTEIVLIALFLINLLLSPITIALSAGYDATYNSDHRRPLYFTVAALGHLARPESIGVLAAAVCYSDLHQAATPALAKAINSVTSEHYGQLGAQTVSKLCRAIDKVEDETLTLALLETLGKIGDGQAIYTVEEMVEKGQTARLRDTAAYILPILYARKEQEAHSAMLLRCALPATSASDQLLRPAEGVDHTEPQQLLRAGGVNEQ